MKIIPFTKDQWATRWDQVESFLIDNLGVNDQAALTSMRFETPFIAFDNESIVGYAYAPA